MQNIEILEIIEKEDNYVLQKELWHDKEEDRELVVARNKDNKIIGTEKDLNYLVKENGILPISLSKNDDICSLGFSDKHQKWFGWVKRNIYGYGINHVVEEGNIESYGGMEVGFKCQTLEDAKQCAISFVKAQISRK